MTSTELNRLLKNVRRSLAASPAAKQKKAALELDKLGVVVGEMMKRDEEKRR